MKHSIIISLTEACNWKCNYCHNKSTVVRVDYDYVIKILEYIMKNHSDDIKHLIFSGGEPGLLNVNFWSDVIYLIKKYHFKSKVKIYTNGSIFNLPIIDNLLSNINSVRWHCVPTLNDKITKYDINFDKYDIEQVIVYRPNNILALVKFLEINKHKILENFLISYDTNVSYRDYDLDALNLVINKFKSKIHVINVGLEHKPSKENRLNCMVNYPTMRIDMEEKTISPCCKIIDSNIQLNEFNFSQLITNQICSYSLQCLNCNSVL